MPFVESGGRTNYNLMAENEGKDGLIRPRGQAARLAELYINRGCKSQQEAIIFQSGGNGIPAVAPDEIFSL